MVPGGAGSEIAQQQAEFDQQLIGLDNEVLIEQQYQEAMEASTNTYDADKGNGTDAVIGALKNAGVAFAVFHYQATVNELDAGEGPDRELVFHLYIGFVNETPETSGLQIIQTCTAHDNFSIELPGGMVDEKDVLDQSPNNDNSPFYYNKTELNDATDHLENNPHDKTVYSMLFDDSAARPFLSTNPSNTISWTGTTKPVGLQNGLYYPLITIIWGGGTTEDGQFYLIGTHTSPNIISNPLNTPSSMLKIILNINRSLNGN